MSRSKPSKPGQASQRQLRVGELVRHALAEVLSRGEFSDPHLQGHLITIAEVRMSADLRHATVLVAPLVESQSDAILAALNHGASFLRNRMAPAISQMRSIPDLRFRLDTRFEDDRRIDALLRSPDVVRDLGDEDQGDDDAEDKA
ncbi:ribosome-binding factor A [Faunimonas pinastri]|uniref:Ribosome-binding factor A n=1 Tax=Faunimonas pinastri TaxID=1855383 RepID=A0A1H9GLU8_9HYPH|nr:30S ribosome-binding factor RbfA [Faunimonas pinastri]SEQ51061.1 ribosome-binding factor A [Faunimonas pinastri]